jgi:hypothetical protein
VATPAIWSDTEDLTRSVCMVDDHPPAEPDEVSDTDEELEEADEESFPASDPPASWSGRDE